MGDANRVVTRKIVHEILDERLAAESVTLFQVMGQVLAEMLREGVLFPAPSQDQIDTAIERLHALYHAEVERALAHDTAEELKRPMHIAIYHGMLTALKPEFIEQSVLDEPGGSPRGES